MTTRSVNMGLTLPGDVTGYSIDALVVVSGLQREVDEVYSTSSPETSISFTFEDYDGIEVYFIFYLYGAPYQPQTHGPYLAFDFPAP